MRSLLLRCTATLTVVALALSVSACGDDDTTSTTTPSAPSSEVTDTTVPDTTVPVDTATPATPAPVTTAPTTTVPETTLPEVDVPVAVYFMLDERAAPVRRHVTDLSDGLLAATFEAWLAGPTPDEEAAGYVSTVPRGTRLLSVGLADDLVVVDLSSEFESGGGSATMQARLAELVMTAYTAAIVLDGVLLLIDGVEVTTFSGEGLLIDGPLTIEDVEPQLPIIVQHSILAGDEVSPGDQISGWANVFEATVSVQVVDEDGNVLSDSFTNATCGTGCRGRFTTFLDPGSYLGPATLRLFEVSSKDGSETNVVEIPITVV